MKGERHNSEHMTRPGGPAVNSAAAPHPHIPALPPAYKFLYYCLVKMARVAPPRQVLCRWPHYTVLQLCLGENLHGVNPLDIISLERTMQKTSLGQSLAVLIHEFRGLAVDRVEESLMESIILSSSGKPELEMQSIM